MTTLTSRDVRLQMRNYIDSVALNTALELGLFWQLAETPQTAEEASRTLGIPPQRCGAWLELLAGMGYLERRDELYAPTAAARTAILDAFSRETWGHLAEEERLRFPFGVDLARSMGHPLSVWAAQNHIPHDYLISIREDPGFARRFTNMLGELHLKMAEELAGLLDMRGARRVMDLGGGSGVVSLALLRRHPELSAVVVDHPHVCVAGREIAAARPEGERLTYRAGDFLYDDLPDDCDVALLCDVGVYSETLFRKIWCALNRGGRLVIVDDFESPAGQPSRACLRYAFFQSMTRSVTNGARPSIADVQKLLARAGFQLSVEQRLTDGSIVLQGRK
jgi:ubiquinone/menaquinone biosynthesis C-methylase UbiE